MIVGMTDGEAAVYDELVAAGLDCDIALLHIMRNTDVELQVIEDIEKPEEVKQPREEPVKQPEPVKTEDISQN